MVRSTADVVMVAPAVGKPAEPLNWKSKALRLEMSPLGFSKKLTAVMSIRPFENRSQMPASTGSEEPVEGSVMMVPDLVRKTWHPVFAGQGGIVVHHPSWVPTNSKTDMKMPRVTAGNMTMHINHHRAGGLDQSGESHPRQYFRAAVTDCVLFLLSYRRARAQSRRVANTGFAVPSMCANALSSVYMPGSTNPKLCSRFLSSRAVGVRKAVPVLSQWHAHGCG
jgi:hypothetical protein